MRFKRLITFIVFSSVSFALVPDLYANSPVGVWKSKDKKTGEFKAHIQIYEKDGKLYGKITKLLLAPMDSFCSKCTGDFKDQPVVGMEVLWDLIPDGNCWEGKTLDVEKGKIFKVKIWLDGTELKVRGYLGPFYETQTWSRVE